jgi:hypothetical protein
MFSFYVFCSKIMFAVLLIGRDSMFYGKMYLMFSIQNIEAIDSMFYQMYLADTSGNVPSGTGPVNTNPSGICSSRVCCTLNSRVQVTLLSHPRRGAQCKGHVHMAQVMKGHLNRQPLFTE